MKLDSKLANSFWSLSYFVTPSVLGVEAKVDVIFFVLFLVLGVGFFFVFFYRSLLP